MKEYNLQVKVRNNYLLATMRARGYETVAELSRASGVSQSQIGLYLNLKRAPLTTKGERLSAQKLCAVMDCPLEALFPQEHLYDGLDKNKAEAEVGIDDVRGLLGDLSPDYLLESAEKTQIVQELMAQLTDRERRVISLRYGFEGEPETLEQVGRKLDVTRERIRQIEAKALRKLRHPKRSGGVCDAIDI